MGFPTQVYLVITPFVVALPFVAGGGWGRYNVWAYLVFHSAAFFNSVFTGVQALWYTQVLRRSGFSEGGLSIPAADRYLVTMVVAVARMVRADPQFPVPTMERLAEAVEWAGCVSESEGNNSEELVRVAQLRPCPFGDATPGSTLGWRPPLGKEDDKEGRLAAAMWVCGQLVGRNTQRDIEDVCGAILHGDFVGAEVEDENGDRVRNAQYRDWTGANLRMRWRSGGMERALWVALVVLGPVIFTHLLPGIVAYGWLVPVPVLAVAVYCLVAFGLANLFFDENSPWLEAMLPVLFAPMAAAFVFPTLSFLGATVWMAWLYNGSGYIGAIANDWYSTVTLFTENNLRICRCTLSTSDIVSLFFVSFWGILCLFLFSFVLVSVTGRSTRGVTDSQTESGRLHQVPPGG